ncbi:unnamed protein product [Porites lobata]|uniref:Uncharacterized protein n=1 Tax=Porites lobata TaxID=104759 RepID=A0ABN8PFN1_9CNID|nr:unnamed protein product [Porites lobata]
MTPHGFMFRGIFPTEVYDKIMSLKVDKIARDNGIISKLRHYLTLLEMKQIYYSLIYPYISDAILVWGSAYKTHIDKIYTS